MLMKLKEIVLAGLLWLLLITETRAQETYPDSSSGSLALTNLINRYFEAIADNAHLYSGSEYITSDRQIKGNPFFDTAQMVPGSVIFDGYAYGPVPMQYDIQHDELVINRYGQYFRIRLATEKISSFSMLGHPFYRLVQDSAKGPEISSGFYERLYDGPSKVYVKRIKTVEEKIIQNIPYVQYIEEKRYIIEKDQVFYRIKSKKNLLDLFSDKKKEIRKYLRKKGLTVWGNPEMSLVSAASFYDQAKK
jgi:hypothetical protein